MGHILEALEPFSDCAVSRAHEVTHSMGHIVGGFSDTTVARAHAVTHSVGHLVWPFEKVGGFAPHLFEWNSKAPGATQTPQIDYFPLF